MKTLADSILDLFTLTPNGLYVEVGSNDGIRQSNTIALEKKGWKGWLIEPSLVAFEKCKQNRSPDNVFINLALSSPEREGTMQAGDFHDGHLMSSFGGRSLHRIANTAVECITLSTLVKEYNIPDVDLFVLDVEGHELEAVRGWKAGFYPKLVVIEITGDTKPIEDIMHQLGYNFIRNISNFTKANTPSWNGCHNDYLFEHI